MRIADEMDQVERDELQRGREAAARAIGLDPSIIVWPTEQTSEPLEPRLQKPHWNEPLPLEDGEWAALAPYFPPEPPQAGAIVNRSILEAVLRVIAGERPWSVLDGTGVSSEAVRKRFARLARRGVWQQLAQAGETLDLPEGRLVQLRAVARRARKLGQT
jgi:transposase